MVTNKELKHYPPGTMVHFCNDTMLTFMHVVPEPMASAENTYTSIRLPAIATVEVENAINFTDRFHFVERVIPRGEVMIDVMDCCFGIFDDSNSCTKHYEEKEST